MKKNMGKLDRVVRVILALIIAILYFTGQMSGLAAMILGAIVFLLTSAVGFCPLYLPFKLSTVKGKAPE
jgi:Na+(H+)/acetate symporter ActP